MKIAMRTVVAGIVGVLALSAGALAPAQALTPTRMTAFTMTPAVAAPTGLGTTTVTVSTHLVDPDGVEPVDAVDWQGTLIAKCPCVEAFRFPFSARSARLDAPQPGKYYVPLTLTSGTNRDGTWTGRFQLGSGQTGPWVVQILAGDFGLAQNPSDPFFYPFWDRLPSPFTNVGIDLRGTNRPVISLLSVVKTNGRYLLKGTAYRATTRTPIRNTRFEITGECKKTTAFFITGVRTNNVGAFTASLSLAQLPYTSAAIFNDAPEDNVCIYQVAYPGPWRLTQSVTRPIP